MDGGAKENSRVYLLRRAEFRDCPVQHVEVIEEIHSYDNHRLELPDEVLRPTKRTHHAPRATRSDPRPPAAALQGAGCLSPVQSPRATAIGSGLYGSMLGGLTSVASAYLRSWYCFVPSGTSLRGLKVRVLPLAPPRTDIDQHASCAERRANLQAEECRHGQFDTQ